MPTRALVSCLVLLSAAPCPAQVAAAAPERPNIVVFLADDLGWKDVGFHGSEIRTPNIDKLAATGTRLDEFYVQSVCSPTRAAFLTGRYPIRTGTQVGVIRPYNRNGLPLRERLLSQVLKSAGYETAICGKWHLGLWTQAQLPTSRGFDHQYGHYCGAIQYFTRQRDGGKDWHRDDEPLDEEGYSTSLIGAEAARLIRNRDVEKPLFLYIPFNAPHTPLQAPDQYIAAYADIKKRKRRIFAAMVSCMDDAIGRVLKTIDDEGLRDNTLVLFFSDNGGPTRTADNGQLRGGKGSYFEGGVRVPCVVRWPGQVAAGKVVPGLMHAVDLLPTLARVAGATTDGCQPLDGKDAWETIAAGKPSPRTEFLINSTPSRGAIRVGGWKLIKGGARREKRGAADEQVQLFHLEQDPYEKHNVAADHPETVADLSKRLAAYADQAVAPIGGDRQPAGFRVPKIWGPPREQR